MFSANQKPFVICICITGELHPFLSQSELKLKGCKYWIRLMWKGYHLSMVGRKGVPFLLQMRYKRVKGWTSPPHKKNFTEYPSPPSETLNFQTNKQVSCHQTVWLCIICNDFVFCTRSEYVRITVEPLSTDTSLIRTVPNVPTKFSDIFFKKLFIIRTLSNTDNRH